MKQYPPEQTVTLNCDASFDHRLQRGGWAVWISATGVCIQRYGQFKECPVNSTDAEVRCVCNAFRLLECHLKDRNIRMVFVNCDNKAVRTIIIKRQVNRCCEQAALMLIDYARKYEQVIAPTIRGHQPGDKPRQYVNNWCDEHSRYYLRRNQ